MEQKSLLYTDIIYEKTIYVLDVMEKLTHIVLTDGEVSLQRYFDRSSNVLIVYFWLLRATKVWN